MLVNILQTFDDANGKRHLVGDNVDVDPVIARRWIADGMASSDVDGRQDNAVDAAALAASGIYPVPQYAWASRPAASSLPVGSRIQVTDVGPQHNEFVTDGSYWRPLGMVPLLFQATEITKTDADTATQTVFSYTVKAGLLAPGCSLYCEGQMSTNAVVAVNKNLNFTLGGVSAGGYLVGTTLKDMRFDLRTKALTDNTFDSWSPGSANSYAASGGAGYVSGSRPLSSSDLTLTATMNWATAGSGSNTLTFRPFKLWLVP